MFHVVLILLIHMGMSGKTWYIKHTRGYKECKRKTCNTLTVNTNAKYLQPTIE